MVLLGSLLFALIAWFGRRAPLVGLGIAALGVVLFLVMTVLSSTALNVIDLHRRLGREGDLRP